LKITHHLYGDESGDFTTKPVFVLGAIKTAEPDDRESELDAICQRYHADFEIKYTSTNRVTLPVRKAFIDLMIDSDEMEFRCVVKSKAHHSLHQFKANPLGLPPQDAAFNQTYLELISECVHHGDRVLVFTDDKSRVKNDDLFTALRREIPQVADAQPMDSKKSRLLQLADLLTGLVYGNLTQSVHPIKREIQRHLLERLGVSDFSQDIDAEKFCVVHWKK
jgi:hypothetical protein